MNIFNCIKNQIFSSLNEADAQIIEWEIDQKNKFEYFIKMFGCLNLGLRFLWFIEFDRTSSLILTKKIVPGNHARKIRTEDT